MSAPPDSNRFGTTRFRERAPQTPRKRMMATGRKSHFMYDAKGVMQKQPGAIEDQHVRAFLESIFQRGTRQSTQDARVFLDEKLAESKLTKEQHAALARLIEQYSFWR